MSETFDLRELDRRFIYNQNDGKIYYSVACKAHGHIRPGQEAGCKYRTGYWMITYKKERIKRSILAWYLMTGIWPGEDIDHIDRNKLNDSWSNLRLASNSLNGFNRKFDIENRGIRYRPDRSKIKPYVVHIKCDGKLIHLGSFASKDKAIACRKKAELKYFGELAP